MTSACLSQPNYELLLKVRAGFVKQGLSLAEWCRANGVARSWAFAVLTGARAGPAALDLRDRLLKEAGVL